MKLFLLIVSVAFFISCATCKTKEDLEAQASKMRQVCNNVSKLALDQSLDKISSEINKHSLEIQEQYNNSTQAALQQQKQCRLLLNNYQKDYDESKSLTCSIHNSIW